MLKLCALVSLLVLGVAVLALGENNRSREHQTSNEITLQEGNNNKSNQGKAGSASLIILSNVFSAKHLELVDQFLYSKDSFLGHNHTLADIRKLAINARAHIDFNNMLIHRYDQLVELEASGGPQANQELCLSQLEQLLDRSKNQDGYDSRDINFHQLMDTFGRAPFGVLQLKTQWEGIPSECKRMSIQLRDGLVSDTSYCLAHFQYHHNRPGGLLQTTLSDLFSMKTGVCLPRACDSRPYKHKFQLIQELVEFNAADHEKGQTSITHLYCLPDSQSTLRTWWRQPASLLTGLILMGWCSLVLYSSYRVYRVQGGSQRAGRLYELLAIQSSFRSLFASSPKPVSLEELQEQVEEISERETIVDLRCVDGIKVLAMCYVMVGIIQMCMAQVMLNLGQMTSLNTNTFLYVFFNLMPSHAINAFFAITGLLTAYLMFKSRQADVALREPTKWLLYVADRYLKIMPMYVLVVAYSKYLAKFMGSGPMWDYGTSALAARGRCQQESWLSILLLGANLRSSADNCLPSAWFFANDFQFFALAAPIFLAVLHRRPQLGKNLLKFCTAAGCGAAIISVLSSEAPDLKPVFSFMPHGFFTRYIFLSTTYTWPLFRIPAYLCGLLIGYELYKFELHQLKFMQAAKSTGSDEPSWRRRKPIWSKTFLNHGPSLILIYLLGCVCAPLMAPKSILYTMPTEWLVLFSWPSNQLVFSLLIGLYILLAATGHGNETLNRFLSAPIWKPLARLNLCVLMVHWEVILYSIQLRDQAYNVDNSFHTMFYPLLISYSYAAAFVAHLLFEAPIRAALNYMVKPFAPNKMTLSSQSHSKDRIGSSQQFSVVKQQQHVN